ncbi:MAG: sensor histidine kinase, partial [Nocardioides sp.]
RAPVTWSLEVDPEAQTVEPGAANLVRRIVQEGVRNAVHHARPTSVAVRVAVARDYGGRRLEVEVEDDGIGLRSADERDAPPGQDSGSHFGVTLLRDLVRDLDGELLLTERPGGGTRLAVEWPLPLDDDGHRTTDHVGS